MRRRRNKYREPTVDILEKMLEDGNFTVNELNILIDKALDEDIQELLELLDIYVDDPSVDFDGHTRWQAKPQLSREIRELEEHSLERMLLFYEIFNNKTTEQLTKTYKGTMKLTWKLLKPVAQNFEVNKMRPLKMPEVKITDTYITHSILPIPWCADGKTYSSRIYKNVANFQKKLAFVLEEGITKGKGYDWMVKSWRKLARTAHFETERLLRTEIAAMWSRSTKDSYLDMGIEYVEIINGNPCEPICAPIVDEGPIPLVEAEIGLDLPPYHPYCQCSFCIYEGLVNGENE